MKTLSAIAAAAFLVGSYVGARSQEQPARRDVALKHIHGLGATDDGSVYVATHAGLFRAAVGTFRLTRVGSDRNDLTGFSAMDDRRFVASGHPQPGEEERPGPLGVIASMDQGRSWASVALVGNADLHVLRAAGERLYGYDEATNRLLISRDGGRSWRSRGASSRVLDLVIDPMDPDALVATTARGVSESDDAGRTWRSSGRRRTGLLAWPPSGGPMLIDGRGRVFVRGRSRRSWQQIGDAAFAPVAVTVTVDDGTVLLATRNGRVLHSVDGGRSWDLRASVSFPD